MTISSEVSKAGPYFGNGSTTVFPYGFKILDEKHIEVVVMDASFVVSTLSLAGGDYTVTGVGSETGGTIVKSSPLLTGQKLNMVRRPDFTQETSLENQGPYYPEVIEGRFDVTVMQIQALKEGLDRAISIPIGEERPEIKDVFDALRESGENADSAAASALLSQRYANEPEDSAISPGLFSAFHWFRKALAQATGAAASAALALTRSNNSQTSATNSANSATASEASRQASGTSATNSANSATASEASRQASGTSATNSANSATASQASRVASETARTGSEAARDTAQTHATNAGNSATSASGSAGTATTKAAESVTARNFSYKWASEVENTQVNDGVRSGYSAYHWAKKAEASVGGQAFMLKSGDTMTGALKAPALIINGADNEYQQLIWSKNDVSRFNLNLDPSGNLALNRYSNAGAYLGLPLWIERLTGKVQLEGTLLALGGIDVRQNLLLPSSNGDARISLGNGDGASYTTYNTIFKGWWGMGMQTYDGSINGYYDFRAGVWDVKGGLKVNGNVVPHGGNKATSADIINGVANKFPDAVAVRDAVASLGPKPQPSIAPSGSAFTLSGIPAGVNKVTIRFNALNLSAAAQLIFRLGTSGGIVSSGYDSACTGLQSSALNSQRYTAFGAMSETNIDRHIGILELSRVDGAAWVWAGSGTRGTSQGALEYSGGVSLPGALSQVQFTTAAGTATFSGTVSIEWE